MVTEVEKYQECYRLPNYRMGHGRLGHVLQRVGEIQKGDTYLDVGCGRAEIVKHLRTKRVEAFGVDFVPELVDEWISTADITALPFEDRSFDFVGCFDVVEHLPEEQVDAALDELIRVTDRVLFITTNDKRSHLGDLELHLTRKPVEWWQAKIDARTENWETSFCYFQNREFSWRLAR